MKDVPRQSAVLTDAALVDPNHDRFGRAPFAARVAKTVASLSDPSSIVVGIFGGWGQGKTSVLNFMMSELRAKPNVIPILFNPWRFASEEELLLSFFTTLSRTVGKEIASTRDQFAKAIDKYSRLLWPAKLFAGVDAEGAAKEVAKLFGEDSLDDLKKNLGYILKSAGKRVVVFMDDIDRLDRKEVQSVFRLIKLSADFENTAYVLFFDDAMVAAALQEQYGAGDIAAGRSFLEKVVQVPLHLPRISHTAFDAYFDDAVTQALRDADVDLRTEERDAFGREFHAGLRDRLHTPRMCKRYANALTFALPLLRGEVDSVDLMLLEGVRLLRPDLYDGLRNNIDGLLSKSLSPLDLVQQAIPTESEHELEAVQGLLRYLFGIDEWTAMVGRRLASPRYASRYFSYSVPPEQVSEAEMAALLTGAAKLPLERLQNDLSGLLQRVPSVPEDFVTMLTVAVENWNVADPDAPPSDLPFRPSVRFAIALAGVGKNLPDVCDLRPSAASRLLVRLAELGGPFSAQFEALRQLVTHSVPVTLAYQCLQCALYNSPNPSHRSSDLLPSLPWRLLVEEPSANEWSDDEQAVNALHREWKGEVERAFTKCVLRSVEDHSLFKIGDGDVGRILLSAERWRLPHLDRAAASADLRREVGSAVKQAPNLAVVLLDWFLSRHLEEISAGNRLLSDYKELGKVVELGVLYDICARAHPQTTLDLQSLAQQATKMEDFLEMSTPLTRDDAWQEANLWPEHALFGRRLTKDHRGKLIWFLAAHIWTKHMMATDAQTQTRGQD